MIKIFKNLPKISVLRSNKVKAVDYSHAYKRIGNVLKEIQGHSSAYKSINELYAKLESKRSDLNKSIETAGSLSESFSTNFIDRAMSTATDPHLGEKHSHALPKERKVIESTVIPPKDEEIALELKYENCRLFVKNHHSKKEKIIKKLTLNSKIDNIALFLFENPNKNFPLNELNKKTGSESASIHKIINRLGLNKKYKDAFFCFTGKEIKLIPKCNYEMARLLNINLEDF